MAKTISQLSVDLQLSSAKFTSEMEKARQSVKGMSADLKLIKFDSIVNLGEKALNTGRQIYQFIELGAKVKSVEDAFNLMAKNSGIAIDDLIYDLKRVTAETIDDSDLMKKATRLISEGFSSEQITVIGAAARTAARLMGTDVSAAYEQIADAVVNLRERGLKTAGFVLDLEEAYSKHAKTVGVTKDELNNYGKQMALVNAIKEKNLELTEKLGIGLGTEYEELQKINAQWNEFKEGIGSIALIAWQELKSYIGSTYTGIKDIIELMGKIKKEYPSLTVEEYGGAFPKVPLGKSQIKPKELPDFRKEERPHGKEWVIEIIPTPYGWYTIDEIQKGIDHVIEMAGDIGESLNIQRELGERSEEWMGLQAGITQEVKETAVAYGITADELLRIRESLQGGIKDNAHFIEGLEESNSLLDTIGKEFGSTLSSNMTQLLSATDRWGEKFKKVGESILQTIMQIIIQQAILNALYADADKQTGLLTSGSGIGRLVSGIGSLLGLAEGIDYVPRTAAYIIHQGEAVIPAGRNIENRREGDVFVSVINNAPNTKTEQKESEDGRGNRSIEIIISELVAKEVNRTGSPVNRSIKGMGGNDQLIRR